MLMCAVIPTRHPVFLSTVCRLYKADGVLHSAIDSLMFSCLCFRPQDLFLQPQGVILAPSFYVPNLLVVSNMQCAVSRLPVLFRLFPTFKTSFHLQLCDQVGFFFFFPFFWFNLGITSSRNLTNQRLRFQPQAQSVSCSLFSELIGAGFSSYSS